MDVKTAPMKGPVENKKRAGRSRPSVSRFESADLAVVQGMNVSGKDINKFPAKRSGVVPL